MHHVFWAVIFLLRDMLIIRIILNRQILIRTQIPNLIEIRLIVWDRHVYRWIKGHHLSNMNFLHITYAPKRGYFPPFDSYIDAKPQVLEGIILKVYLGGSILTPFEFQRYCRFYLEVTFFSISIGECWDTVVKCATTVYFQILTHSP
jgi:hypothetical protein